MTTANSPVIVHVSSPVSWRGGEQQLFYLYSLLKHRQIKQYVFCPLNSPLSHKVDAKHCITYRKRSGFDVLAARNLSSLCRKVGANIIHAHDAHAHTTCILAADIFRNSPDIVLSRRVDFPIRRMFFTSYKYNHKRIKLILCVSDAIRRIVSPSISKDRIKVKTVHSGIDIRKFAKAEKGVLRKELNIPDECVLVGNVAALADHKDYPTFLRTVKELKDDTRFRFVILGTGPMESELKKMATEMGLDDRLFFAGFRHDLPRIMTDLDVLLFPSKTEGLGTSILDAFANRIPVVATGAGGIPEIVIDLRTGLLRDIGDEIGLAEAILKLQNEPNLKQRLIKNATLHLQNFTVESMASKTEYEYRSLLDN